jgi:hypothetical protein
MNEQQQVQLNQLLMDDYRSREQNNAMNTNLMANSVFHGNQNSNLIEYQLELDNILERIEHLLQGHVLEFTPENNLRWVKPKNDILKVFNEYGVQEIMRILTMYLNRNTILSNFDENTINWKVYDFGIRLTDLIFRKYENLFFTPDDETMNELFLDRLNDGYFDDRYMSKPIDVFIIEPDKLFFVKQELKNDLLLEKVKLYEMIVGMLVDTVHATLLRGFLGGERESLRTARMVTQSDNLNPIQNMGMNTNKKQWYNPFTWM